MERLRRVLTRGIQIAAPDQAARRGEEIEALVTVSGSASEDVEAGLVCTETYDEMGWVSGGPDQPDSYERVTTTAVACEEWQPVAVGAGGETVRLRVPSEAPFSYKGKLVSFKWEIVARAHRRHGLDAEAAQEISVLP